MYVTVLENLDLKEGHSFLNIGSGTGYLSCLAACILGDNGLSHGIDCNADVVHHARLCTTRFFSGLIQRRQNGEVDLPKVSSEGVKFVIGNGFNIDVEASSKTCRYDRIYIGAGCNDSDKEYFYSLLSDEGVMVLPIDNRNVLEKITRKTRTFLKAVTIGNVTFASLVRPSVVVENDPASSTAPPPLVVLPALLWAPTKSRHAQFSKTFKDTVRTLLLSTHASSINTNMSTSVCIPSHVLLHIISFCTRDWFVPPKTEVQLLQAELNVERELRQEVEEKLQAALEEQKNLQKKKHLFRFILHRLMQRIGSSVTSVQVSGAYAMEALRSLRQSSLDDFDFAHIGAPLAAAINNIQAYDEDSDDHTSAVADDYDDNEEEVEYASSLDQSDMNSDIDISDQSDVNSDIDISLHDINDDYDGEAVADINSPPITTASVMNVDQVNWSG